MLTLKVLLLFWSLAEPYQGVISIWKEVKDRPARTTNAVFLDIKTHYIYKPTETFQYTDTLPRATSLLWKQFLKDLWSYATKEVNL